MRRGVALRLLATLVTGVIPFRLSPPVESNWPLSRPVLRRMQRLGLSGGAPDISFNSLLTGSMTGAASSSTQTTASMSATAGRVLVLTVFQRVSTGSAAVPTITDSFSPNLSWTEIKETGSIITNKYSIWAAIVGTTGSGTISINPNGSVTDLIWIVFEVIGADTSSITNAYCQTENYGSENNATQISEIFQTPADPKNAVTSHVYSGQTGVSSLTVGSGWTSLGIKKSASTTAVAEIGVEYQVGQSATTPSWTWTGSFSNGMLIVEWRAIDGAKHRLQPHVHWMAGTSGSATIKTTGATMNPAVGSRVFLGLTTKRSGGSADLTSVTWDLGTPRNFAKVGSVAFGTDYRLHLWSLYISSAGSAATVTMTAPSQVVSWAWQIVEIPDASPTDPLTNFVTNTAAASTSISATLSTVKGGTFFVAGSDAGSAISLVPGAGWVSTLPDVGQGSGRTTRHSSNSTVMNAFRSWPGSASPSFTGTSSTDLAIVAVEVTPTPSIPFMPQRVRPALMRSR